MMMHDTKTGRTKKAIPGKCLICNSEETHYRSFGMDFCKDCFSAMRDEDKLAERIVWD